MEEKPVIILLWNKEGKVGLRTNEMFNEKMKTTAHELLNKLLLKIGGRGGGNTTYAEGKVTGIELLKKEIF